jgi:hypothetical protein
MSSACELGVFDHGEERGATRWQGGSFVVLMYRDAAMNKDPQNLVKVAQALLGRIGGSEQHHMGFDMLIEPLRGFFGEQGCFALAAKAIGLGPTEHAAFAATDHALDQLARATYSALEDRKNASGAE